MSDVTMSQDTTLPATPETSEIGAEVAGQIENPGVQETSLTVSDEVSLTDRKMLAEARQTRQMILDFQSAVESGTYSGHKMRAVATGLAFLEVLLRQNTGHIKTLQDRVG